MGAVAVQSDITELLAQAGARIRGRNRADCPECKRFRAVSYTEDTFFCHGCGWTGNAVTLAKELGIYRRIPSAEYRELCQNRERTREASRRLFYASKASQLELQARLRELGRDELLAHEQGADDPKAWDTLASVYADRPSIEQKLDLLESTDPASIFASLTR
ncbi:MAG TPA: hypothetical protein VMW54_14685 [Terriglobia bacterium]|nr:hypothetical protein [Terriglobia bacterium]